MVKNIRRFRPALMTSVALAGLALGNGAAHAEDLRVAAGPSLASSEDDQAEQQAQNARFLINAADAVLERHSLGVTTTITPSQPDPNILIALPGTPTTARDATNITGIAQMVVDNGGGGVGLCTGSLINPRTVLFAAHCVNSRAATAYGANSGGTAIAFGFETNTRANAAGQTDELVRWLFGTGANATGRYQTNTAQAFFNVEAVAYNPLSLEPAARSFLYGDVAIAALDTPAAGIPTWALMFSPLTAPTTITAGSGTGYHVTLAGYGGNGTGTSGNAGIDFRRRTAENWLGAVTSLFNFETFLFGSSDPALRQNLYFLDFDDPARGTSSASPFDFNAFRDNALPREGITAGGDSGGPLILDQTYARQLVIGVLSGGYTRFFNGQPANGYGTVSFYQPLYLYWDWIAANNPYRYVGANAGNGNWEDPTRWVSLTDPNYFIIGPNGQLVNGVPSLTGEEKDGTSNQFGQACFQNATLSDCIDFRTGIETVNSNPIGTNNDGTPASGLANSAGSALLTNGATNQPGSAQIDGGAALLEPQKAATALPPATIANGLPGATNFVPNNTAGNRTAGVLPRYFDVTLSNAGTTTLSSTVTIDRLSVRNTAGLTINSGARLNSLIDITQAGGTVSVNGTLTSVGDFALLAGLLQGTGSITSPFLTSVAGTIAPGTVGTIGTLSLTGNLVLASGTVTHIDVSGTSSDRIVVTGAANVGGVVSVGTGIAGQVNGNGQQFTILTATGGVTGTFTATSLTPILSQRFTYQPNAVLMQISAASYATVIDPKNNVQAAYAALLDQNRANPLVSGLYGLDFASTDTIRSTLNGLAPVNEQAVRSLAGQSVYVIQNFNAVRLREGNQENAGGKIAVSGRPLELAQMSFSPMSQPLGGALMGMQDGDEETTVADLPDEFGIFLSGGFITGDIAALPGYTTSRQMDGYFIAGGIEYFPNDQTMIGVSGYYNSVDAETPLTQAVSSETYAGSVYLRHKREGGMVIEAQATIGSLGLDTTRTVQFLGAAQTLKSSSDDRIVAGALAVSYDLKSGIGTFSPGIEARYANVNLGRVVETGGTVGLGIAREDFESKQVRFGFDYAKKGEMLGVVANAQLVWEFEDGPQVLAANFAQGTGPNANFVLNTADQTWGEVGAALTFGNGPLEFSAGVDTTIGRTDADAQVIRGSATYRF